MQEFSTVSDPLLQFCIDQLVTENTRSSPFVSAFYGIPYNHQIIAEHVSVQYCMLEND